jgi:3-hydroxyacyl-CoA dehydrogenase/mannose-6-phosphate isomerase-like protein (cupin superfamily)
MPGARDYDASIGVVGAGSIGVGWAVAFARAGFRVSVFDVDDTRLEAARRELRAKLDELARFDLLDEEPAAVAERVATTQDLAAALRRTRYVQECAPEDLALKQELFSRLDRAALPETVLASSSSTMPASTFAADLPGRGRCLVAHPANPPYLLPAVELVPAPFTRPAAVACATDVLERAGMSVVRVQVELEGFVLNRLQGALLREAYCLVRDGVASVDDVDRVVRDGPGRRWSVIGPFETADLNTRGGIEAHAARLGPAYERMGAERGQHDPWTADLVRHVAAERRRLLPLERWEERVMWRDRMLMALERARRPLSPEPRAVRHDEAAEIGVADDALAMRPLVTAAHEAGMSVTWVELAGRHRRLRSDRSTRVYYILRGSATFVLGDEPKVDARERDVVVVPRGTSYEFEGDVTYLVLNAPAFVEGDDIYDE